MGDCGTKSDDTVGVFLEGKGTRYLWSFETGAARGRILEFGKGRMLPEAFPTVAAARQLCRARLAEDPALTLCIVRGREVLETVMDATYRQAKEREFRRKFLVLSTLGVAAAALAIARIVIGLETGFGTGAFVGAIVVLYLLLTPRGGSAGNIDGLVAITILLLLTLLVGPTIKQFMEPASPTVSTHGPSPTTERDRGPH